MKQPDLYPKTSVPLWSVRLGLAAAVNWQEMIASALSRYHQARFFGVISSDERSYFFTRYPRREYGIPTNQILERSLEALHEVLVQAGCPPFVVLEHTADYLTSVRTVLGRHRGYDQQSFIRFAEYQKGLPSAFLQTGTILSGYRKNGVTFYTEPAIVVESEPHEVSEIRKLAAELEQERFTVEDFSTGMSTLWEVVR